MDASRNWVDRWPRSRRPATADGERAAPGRRRSHASSSRTGARSAAWSRWRDERGARLASRGAPARRRADHGGADRRARHDPRGQRRLPRHARPASRRARCSRSTRPSRSRSAPRRWAADVLQRDAAGVADATTSARPGRRPLPPLPIDEVGTVAGRLEDLQGRFNLNNLVFRDGTTNPDARQAARAHPRRCSTSSRAGPPRWPTGSTTTRSPGFPDGAEDTRLHGAESAAPRGQHADHARERDSWRCRIRRRALREAQALRDGAAGRHQAECLHRARHRARLADRRTRASSA